MKLFGKTLIIILISFKCFCQDSLLKNQNVNLFDKYLNCTHDNLTKSKVLDSIEVITSLNLKNALHCFIIFANFKYFNNDSLIFSSICNRFREISAIAYNEGNPLIIVKEGLNSVYYTEKLNEENNPYGITYICLGNCCICGDKEKDKAISVFNDETYRLVKYVFPVKEKRRTVFKRFRKV
jgi:hypothetical protein